MFPASDVTTAFVCGCGHSGTTLLATILAEHSDTYVPLYETNAFLKRPLKRRLVLWRLRSQLWLRGKKVLVEKTPRHVRHVDEIRQTIPGARVILMVRDGRDVAASAGKRSGGNFESAIHRWVCDNRAIAAQLGRPDVFLVRYEDLVTDPADTVRQVCEFIGITFARSMLDYHRTPRKWFARRNAWRSRRSEFHDLRNRQINQPIFDGRGRWRSELPHDALQSMTTGAAASLMNQFGYDPDDKGIVLPAAGRVSGKVS